MSNYSIQLPIKTGEEVQLQRKSDENITIHHKVKKQQQKKTLIEVKAQLPVHNNGKFLHRFSIEQNIHLYQLSSLVASILIIKTVKGVEVEVVLQESQHFFTSQHFSGENF